MQPFWCHASPLAFWGLGGAQTIGKVNYMILRNARYSEMAEKIRKDGSRVIIYGSGMIGLIVTPYLIEQYGLCRYVSCYVDMDSRKQGKMVRIGDYEYEVKSPDILRYVKENTVLLITNSNFFGTIDLLDRIPALEHIEGYVIPIMQIQESRYAKNMEIRRYTEEAVIPKKIHYCWFGGKRMPDFLKTCIETWSVMCPEYEIIQWDETNYNVSKIPYMEEAFSHGKYGFVSDVARLDILYTHGGIYMDTDVTLLRNMDELLFQEAFVGVEKWGNINTGGGCGAAPQHAMIKRLLEYRSGFHFVMEDGSLNMETNGMYETRVFIESGMQVDNTLQRVGNVTVYPSVVFHPYDYVSCEDQAADYTFSKHHFWGGWMGKKGMEERKDTQKRYRQILKRMEG